jgi:hypothetical protein
MRGNTLQPGIHWSFQCSLTRVRKLPPCGSSNAHLIQVIHQQHVLVAEIQFIINNNRI